jgi:hypothetical protein
VLCTIAHVHRSRGEQPSVSRTALSCLFTSLCLHTLHGCANRWSSWNPAIQHSIGPRQKARHCAKSSTRTCPSSSWGDSFSLKLLSTFRIVIYLDGLGPLDAAKQNFASVPGISFVLGTVSTKGRHVLTGHVTRQCIRDGCCRSFLHI